LWTSSIHLVSSPSFMGLPECVHRITGILSRQREGSTCPPPLSGSLPGMPRPSESARAIAGREAQDAGALRAAQRRWGARMPPAAGGWGGQRRCPSEPSPSRRGGPERGGHPGSGHADVHFGSKLGPDSPEAT
jgi:hypothetical protein